MDEQAEMKSKNSEVFFAKGHSPEIQQRIEQLSRQIMELNYNLYRRLENK